MRRIYAGFAGLLFLGTVAMFFFAAVGAFDARPNEESFAVHRSLGHALIAAALLTTVVAALARAPRRLIGLSALVGALAIGQFLIALIAGAIDDGGSSTVAATVFGVHALGGLITMGVARMVFLKARELVRAPASGLPTSVSSGVAAGSAA